MFVEQEQAQDQGTIVSVAESGTPGWQIVAYVAREGQPPRYAAIQHGRRRVWGLREPGAAARWITRLTRPAQVPLGGGNAVA